MIKTYRNQRLPGTRIFSSLAVQGLCVPIGRYMYLFKRLTAVLAGRFYRFEHIVSYSSGKVVGKVTPQACRSPLSIVAWLLDYFFIPTRDKLNSSSNGRHVRWCERISTVTTKSSD